MFVFLFAFMCVLVSLFTVVCFVGFLFCRLRPASVVVCLLVLIACLLLCPHCVLASRLVGWWVGGLVGWWVGGLVGCVFVCV